MAVGLFDFFLIETTLKSPWRAIREHLRYLSRNLSYFIFSLVWLPGKKTMPREKWQKQGPVMIYSVSLVK